MKYKVDAQATAKYADQYNEPCDCIYCQNFNKTFATTYPKVIEVLKEFGIPVEQPLEIIDCYWNDTKDKRRYECYYSVKGNLAEDKLQLYAEDAIIALY